MTQLRIDVFAGSDVGLVREGNEDSMYAGSTVFAVADGMGGHRAGEIASETALRPLAELDGAEFDDADAASEALSQAIKAANRRVVNEATDNPEYAGMGTTLTAALVRDGHLHLAHVGDSRAYLLRGGQQVAQLTTDHTLVEQLVQEGRLSRDEAGTHPQRSVITRAIGVEADIEVDSFEPLALEPGDQILLCSDGLSGPVSDAEITDILLETPDGDQAVRDLLSIANDHGGPDNITVVLLRVGAAGQAGAQDRFAAAGATAAAGPMGAGSTPEGDSAPRGTRPARRDDTTISLGRVGTREPDRRSIPIRTRPESEGHDWASDFGRYAQRAPVDGDDRRGRGGRLLALLTGILVLLAVLGVGGWLLLSRAFFVGEADGEVAIYNGVPHEVAGVALYRLRATTGLPLDDLAAFRAQRVRETITAGDMAEAQAIVADLRSEATGEAPGESPSPAPDASESTQR